MMPFFQQLHIFSWKDIIEILILATIIYFFMLWLKKDTKKNLIPIFYGYCFFIFGSYFFNFASLTYFLFMTAPAALMLFILVHQETLQKNFVMLRKFHVPEATPTNWLDEFMRACLAALNKNYEFVCVIEGHDKLKDLIKAPCVFYADLKKDIFDLLIEKQTRTTDFFVWINREGKLVAINAHWNHTLIIHEGWVTPEAQQLHQWKQEALLITSKSDALILKAEPLSRTFTISFQGKLLENLSAEQTALLLSNTFNSATCYTQPTHKENSRETQR